jgi:DNA-directed RNA polymerase subunit M/transcription elongation factor TFIIS
MSNFCEVCNNVLDMNTRPDSLVYHCIPCSKSYELKAKDTLLYDNNKNTDTTIHRNILHSAGRDPTNQRVYKTCDKCNNTVATQIRIGDNMVLVNTCVKCGNQWKG